MIIIRKPIVFLLVVFLLSTSIYLDSGPIPYKFPSLLYFPPLPQASDNPVTIEGAELGRYLFYDPILSKNYDMSCASCHKQAKAFSDAPHPFSSGNQGKKTSRNAMPLFNLAWYPAFFWDGRANTLEEQVLHPVRDTNEMNLPWTEATQRINASKFYKRKFQRAFPHQTIDSTLIAKAIAQFLRTLISHNAKFDSVLAGITYLSEEEYAGFVLMNDMTKGGCLHCHTTDANALGTTGEFSNNGLDSIYDPILYKDYGLGGYTKRLEDYGKFKIPSLRNVVITAPYMHDGRFHTLEQVLDFYSDGVHQSANIDSKMEFAHQGGSKLSPKEKKQIIAFLHTLTDKYFISNPQFSNPFKKM